MKPTFLLLVALAVTPPLMAAQMASKHHATAMKEPTPTNFSVKNADGSMKNYSLEIPAAPSPAPSPAPAGSEKKISQQAAILAALGWAPAFYGSSGTAATSVDYMTEPIPYYLVHLTGKIGDSTQPLYAAVLEDGRIVRPIESTAAPMKEMKPSHKSKAEKTKKATT
jgi:hypothetical protein